MKIKTIFLLVAIMLLSIHHAKATAALTMPLNKMDDAADEILSLTKMNHFHEAKLLLNSFSKEYPDRMDHYFTQDDLKTLKVTQDQAIEAVSNKTIQSNEKIMAVTTFRLVVDALNSKYQPLWTEMKQPIMIALNDVKITANKGNFEDFQEKINIFLNEYSMIEPSLSVDIPAPQLQKLNAKIAYIEKYKVSMLENSSRQKDLENLGDNLQAVFDEMSRDETDPSLWGVIFTTGSIIIFTLSYVGWRKYRGQKQDKARKEHND